MEAIDVPLLVELGDAVGVAHGGDELGGSTRFPFAHGVRHDEAGELGLAGLFHSFRNCRRMTVHQYAQDCN
mgnify:CR=1 FL=1